MSKYIDREVQPLLGQLIVLSEIMLIAQYFA